MIVWEQFARNMDSPSPSYVRMMPTSYFRDGKWEGKIPCDHFLVFSLRSCCVISRYASRCRIQSQLIVWVQIKRNMDLLPPSYVRMMLTNHSRDFWNKLIINPRLSRIFTGCLLCTFLTYNWSKSQRWHRFVFHYNTLSCILILFDIRSSFSLLPWSKPLVCELSTCLVDKKIDFCYTPIGPGLLHLDA